jgi:hypothetical protein
MAVAAATEILWLASGRQFGECSATILPCPGGGTCTDPWAFGPQLSWTGSWPNPSLIGGLWYNLGCSGSCPGDCSCNSGARFALPGPVGSIVSIVIDDETVPTGSYRLLNGQIVERLDGGSWPLCNDGSWLVTVLYGAEVPSLGLMAAAELACELVKACTPGQTCRLPARVSSIVRQGVSKEWRGTAEKVAAGGTVGLYLSDMFIDLWNPGRLTSPPRMYSPDMPFVRTVT